MFFFLNKQLFKDSALELIGMLEDIIAYIMSPKPNPEDPFSLFDLAIQTNREFCAWGINVANQSLPVGNVIFMDNIDSVTATCAVRMNIRY